MYCLSQYQRRLRIKRATSKALTLIASGTFQRNRWRTDACFQVWSWRYFLLFSIAMSTGDSCCHQGNFTRRRWPVLCICLILCLCIRVIVITIVVVVDNGDIPRDRWPVGSKPQAPPTIKPLLLLLQSHHHPYHHHNHHRHHHHCNNNQMEVSPRFACVCLEQFNLGEGQPSKW